MLPCAAEPGRWLIVPKSGRPSARDQRAIEEAQTICATECPIQRRCLRIAMEAERGKPVRERHHIFGGLTPSQRVDLEKRTTEGRAA